MSAIQPTNQSHQLDAPEIDRYRTNGFLCPVSAIGAGEAGSLLQQLEQFERRAGATLGKLTGQYRAKTHLLFPWLYALCKHPAVLAPVQAFLGPDLLVYHVTCWLKEPGDSSFVSWHQDGTYFHLDPPEHTTAWVALTDSTMESGCVQVLPGSHKLGQLDHGTRPSTDNLLSNGQHILRDLDKSSAKPLVLKVGQLSLHDTLLVHSSGPNQSAYRRVGIGISYIPTRVRFKGDHRVTATLACGNDAFGHFDAEPAPIGEADEAARSFHRLACERFFAKHGYERGGADR